MNHLSAVPVPPLFEVADQTVYIVYRIKAVVETQMIKGELCIGSAACCKETNL